MDGTGEDFIHQKDIYPASEYKKDALDAAAKAISSLKRPWSEYEDEEYREEEEEEKERVRAKCGY